MSDAGRARGRGAAPERFVSATSGGARASRSGTVGGSQAATRGPDRPRDSSSPRAGARVTAIWAFPEGRCRWTPVSKAFSPAGWMHMLNWLLEFFGKEKTMGHTPQQLEWLRSLRRDLVPDPQVLAGRLAGFELQIADNEREFDRLDKMADSGAFLRLQP